MNPRVVSGMAVRVGSGTSKKVTVKFYVTTS
jgi:hypothetical protein